MLPYRCYFIRHAHREEFDSNEWGHEISITSQGKKGARQFGKTLAKSQIKEIWTSPIKRCVQTTEAIKKGIGVDVPIYNSSLLGDPGFMILNPKIAEDAFRKHHLFELIDHLLEGNSVPGFRLVNVGCTLMLRKLFENKQVNRIWISHDINVCILACWIFGCDQSKNMIPKFLEGIEFSFDETGVFAYFKGLRTKIDETILREALESMEKPASLNSELNSLKVRS